MRHVWLVVVALGAAGGRASAAPAPDARLDRPFVVTQIPAGTDLEKRPAAAAGTLRAPYGEGGRLLLVAPDGAARVLSEGFHSACDPEVSFDAARLLFAGKRAAADAWNVFEMQADGTGVRQITRDRGDCRQPAYQATLYTLDSPQPWYQITFVSDAAGLMDEYGAAVATHLYSCKLDGSALRRLTFTVSGDMDPFLMADGRLLLASWQRFGLDRGLAGRVALFGVGIDGTDYAVLAADEGRRVKHMPCTTTRGLAVFVEADAVGWDGAGRLACVSLRRPLHSYRPLTDDGDGLFHTPSPLPDGQILVSRRASDGSGTHGVWRLDPATGRRELVFDDPAWHDIQAHLIHPRPEPDGRSTVVAAKDPHGKLYCLNVYLSDVEPSGGMPPGSVKRLRVLEGVAVRAGKPDVYLPAGGRYPAGATVHGIPPLVQRRILGEIDVEEDGSFNVEVPANVPIQLQTLDADGMALRSSAWVWARNHEPRGCIGCHEDGELTPENTFVQAMTRPSVVLCLPAERRRTVDFRRDVMPIVSGKCASCHRGGGPVPRLDGGPAPAGGSGVKMSFSGAYEALLAGEPAEARGPWRGRFVQPGQARTSPLVWRLFARNTSRPWDAAAGEKRDWPGRCGAHRLTDDEKRTFIEWIDMGALWDGIPAPDAAPAAETADPSEGVPE